MLRSRSAVQAEKERLAQKRVEAVVKSGSTTSPIDAVLFQRPSTEQVDEQWARAVVRNGLALDLVNDAEFRKALLMTAKAGMSYAQMQKDGTQDVKLPHRTKLTSVSIPALDAKLDKKVSQRVERLIAETGGCLLAAVAD